MTDQKNFNYEPRIGVLGKTGVGKSSLCNALFGSDVCPISDVAACTRAPREVLLDMGGKGIILVDVPGVGESASRDEEYGKLYASLLPELDLVLWVLKADDRAMASDESFFKKLVKPHLKEEKPFFFVLNQVDKMEPLKEWEERDHQPGPNQQKNIQAKVEDIARFFDIPASKVISVSANEKYHLTELVNEFVWALPAERKKPVFDQVNADYRSSEADDYVSKSLGECVTDAVCDVITSGLDATGNILVGALDVVEKAVLAPIEIADKILDRCYITTAVCKNEGKADDCYELTAFRSFRDGWLLRQPDGEALVREYYRTAPAIVSAIDQRDDHALIYDSIWKRFLLPCLRDIETERFSDCKSRYMRMVGELKTTYLS